MITNSDDTDKENKEDLSSIDDENWYVEIIDNSGGINSIALDSNGHPHISYTTSLTYNSGINYAYWNGKEWNIELVDGYYDICGYNSIALDSNNHPYISYYNNIYGLQCAYYNGTNWTIDTVDSTAIHSVWNSIGLDRNGHPCISYYDILDEDLNYAHWNGTNWNIELIDSNGDVGERCSMVLDSNDYPHICYFDDIPNNLKYAHWNGTEWNIEIIENVGEFAFYSSIDIDSNDYPHISYLKRFPPYMGLKYAYSNGINWATKVIADNHVTHTNSIAIDNDDNPHISYSHDINSSVYPYYFYWNGTDWISEMINESTGNSYFKSIALDNNNHPHVCFYNEENNILYYATKMENQPPVTDFVYLPIIPYINQTISFTDISYDPVGSIVDWYWDFGDSETSTQQYPSHNYSTAGVYTVELTVTDNDGAIDTHSKIIPVGLDIYYLQDLNSGWNFISLPFNESIGKNDLLLKHDSYYYDIGYLFGWNRLIQSYEFSYVLYPGYGYWLYSNDDDELWIIDIHTDYDSYITTVEEGWNIMGVPYYNLVDKTDVLVDGESWDTAVSNSWISDYMFDWYETGQSYVFSDTFMPTEAYWLYSYQNCILKRNN